MMGSTHHLILGGTGFIGRHVALMLARSGMRVTIASRAPGNFRVPADAADRISWRQFDFAAPDWDRLVADADTVHHYAWTSIPSTADADPDADRRINLGATAALLEALRRRGGGRVLFASSGGTVYGKLLRVPADEDHPLAPITAYGRTKLLAERCLARYRAEAGLDCRIVRIANPFGAGQNPAYGLGAMTTFLDCVLHGRDLVIWGDGEVVRDYVHISDVAACLASLACMPAGEEYVFNVGSGVGTSLNAIVRHLEARIGRKLPVRRTAGRPYDVPVSVLCTERARRVLGWAPRLALRDGMMRALADLGSGAQFSTLDDWSPPLPGMHEAAMCPAS